MKDSVEVGMNKTGVQMAPALAKEMQEGIEEFKMPSSRSEITPDDLKAMYIRESGQLGTVPIPGTFKGALSTGLQKLAGKHPAVLIDKLGERLAFERSGVRLYDALIAKCQASQPNLNLDLLYEIREDEAQHFRLVRDVMESLGADWTAQTPCADASGVMSMGLMQTLNDPRTSIAQCVQAILIAELADNDSWQLLIQLTQESGLDEITQKFTVAKANEDRHLTHIRSWLSELIIKNDAVPVQ